MLASGSYKRLGTHPGAVLLVVATAVIVSGLGFHAHQEAGLAGDDGGTSSRPRCHVCALNQASAVKPSALVVSVATPIAEPVAVDAEQPRTACTTGPRLGRAPPAC